MIEEERFHEIKEKEIIRLTTPISYPKFGNFTFRVAPRDCEGNLVPIIRGFRNRYILEPKPDILSDDEILMFAPESKEAYKIRLKRGIGNKSDKTTVNDDLIRTLLVALTLLFMFAIFALISNNLILKVVFLLIIIGLLEVMFMLFILKIILNLNITIMQ